MVDAVASCCSDGCCCCIWRGYYIVQNMAIDAVSVVLQMYSKWIVVGVTTEQQLKPGEPITSTKTSMNKKGIISIRIACYAPLWWQWYRQQHKQKQWYTQWKLLDIPNYLKFKYLIYNLLFKWYNYNSIVIAIVILIVYYIEPETNAWS